MVIGAGDDGVVVDEPRVDEQIVGEKRGERALEQATVAPDDVLGAHVRLVRLTDN